MEELRIKEKRAGRRMEEAITEEGSGEKGRSHLFDEIVNQAYARN